MELENSDGWVAVLPVRSLSHLFILLSHPLGRLRIQRRT